MLYSACSWATWSQPCRAGLACDYTYQLVVTSSTALFSADLWRQPHRRAQIYHHLRSSSEHRNNEFVVSGSAPYYSRGMQAYMQDALSQWVFLNLTMLSTSILSSLLTILTAFGSIWALSLPKEIYTGNSSAATSNEAVVRYFVSQGFS